MLIYTELVSAEFLYLKFNKIRRNFTNSERVNKEYLYPTSIQKLYPKLGQISKLAGNYTSVSSNTRIIPYTKAVSMGLKVY